MYLKNFAMYNTIFENKKDIKGLSLIKWWAQWLILAFPLNCPLNAIPSDCIIADHDTFTI